MRHNLTAVIIVALLIITSCTQTPPITISKNPTIPTLPKTFEGEFVTLPFSVPGPYSVGRRTVTAVDASRDDREISITVWYPAKPNTGSDIGDVWLNADPYPAGKPYPLILSSTKVARIFATYLVSYGFTWASVDGIDSYPMISVEMIDQPLDILFALDFVATSPPDELRGMIDSDHAGTIGYSFDGYNSYALSGARIDPSYYRAQCPEPDALTKSIQNSMSAFFCLSNKDWNAFVKHTRQSISAPKNQLWQAMTDERIRAVMPLAGEGWWLFGEKGLATADRPVLTIVAGNDELNPENTLIHQYLGTPDKTLIYFVGEGHMMIYNQLRIERMAHFAVVFFSYYLKGQSEMAQYFSKDFVSQYKDLLWGGN